MKNLVAVVLAAFVFGLCYLIGCFCQAGFNITLWSEGWRTFVAFFGAICSGFTFLCMKGVTNVG